MMARVLIILSFFCFMIGSLLFCVHREFIVFRFTHNSLSTDSDNHAPIYNINHIYYRKKKEIIYHFWHDTKWHEEKKESLWFDKKEQDLKQILSTWLALVVQEGVVSTITTVQTVALTSNGCCAFVSFDHNPLPQEGPIYYKLMFLEGLLKSIRANDIKIQFLYFLHNHKPLQDTHIDFSQPWPLDGFITS